jgi:hypothetical protein
VIPALLLLAALVGLIIVATSTVLLARCRQCRWSALEVDIHPPGVLLSGILQP